MFSTPFIYKHGLGYNRVVTLQMVIYAQEVPSKWGETRDKVDQNSIDRFEVIKGPCKLKLMGQMLLAVWSKPAFFPPPLFLSKILGSVSGNYGTNNIYSQFIRLQGNKQWFGLGNLIISAK